MKNQKLQVALVLVLTATALCGLLMWDPFRHLRDVFAKSGPVKEDALIHHLVADPSTQETSNGREPLSNLRSLEANWCGVAKPNRFILTGNSQTLTILLAPGEARPADPQRTYPDLLIDRLNSAGIGIHGYRLSAPNISYMEALWYLHFLLVHPCLVPGEFIVQLNFETFRKTSIREGMLELLDDETFLKVVEREAQSDAPYASTFQQALDRYKSRNAKEKGVDSGAAATGQTGLVEAGAIGGLIETEIRSAVDLVPLLKSRGEMKAELLDFLYLARVNLLGITPTTKRSLGGGTLTANIGSLTSIGELSKRNGIRLVFFNAPQNPNVPLYRTASDREQYLGIVNKLSRESADAYFDFENIIPGDMWGVWIDGPDPIHFGLRAHHLLADAMFEAGVVQGSN